MEHDDIVAILTRLDERSERVEKWIARRELECKDLRIGCQSAYNARLVVIGQRIDEALASLASWRTVACVLTGVVLASGYAHAGAVVAWLRVLL